VKALIAGAGTAGLCAAIALGNVGVETTVVEQAAEPRKVGAGLNLWTNALVALRAVGAEEPVRQAGTEIERKIFLTSTGRVIADWPLGDAGRRLGAPTMGVRRPDLQAALLGALGRDGPRYATACTGFEQDEEGVTVLYEGGDSERADVLIGADGIDSIIRKQILGAAPPRYSGYTGWRAVLPWEDERVARFMLFMGRRGSRILTYPVGPEQRYFLATSVVPQGERHDPTTVKSILLERFGDFPEPIPSILGATAAESIMRTDIVDRDPVSRWGEGRVTLIGDAAHPMTPNLAMGACAALEDGVVLAQHLTRADDPQTGLRSFERARMKRTADFTMRSRKLGDVSHLTGVAASVRNVVLTPMMRTVGFRRTVRDITFEA
jgi:2-polyprenyl-6-methoxyphenol hydroxylase-like FAD-dependent oxidoreductase